MKLQAGLYLFLAISSAFALPARNPDDDAEIVPTSRRQQTNLYEPANTDADPDFKDFKGVVDTGSGYPFFSVRPYNLIGTGFFDNFEETFRRLRENLWNRWWSAIPQPSDFDPSEGNTTSVVKVIDGHKVEINDTVYTKTDDSGNSIFKVRVVNIRPLDSSEEDVPASSPVDNKSAEDDKGSPEVIEKGSQDNEDNEILGNIDSTENTELHTTPSPSLPAPHDSFETTETIENLLQNLQSNQLKINEEINRNDKDVVQESITSDETNEANNSGEEIKKSKNNSETINTNTEKDIEQLNSETKNSPTNERLIETSNNNNREPITDSESSSEEMIDDHWDDNHNFEWDSISTASNDKNNNNIDVYDSIPVDLSNDIAINEMLADQGAPFDPEAEVFAVDEFVPEYERSRYQYDQPIKSQPLSTNINFTPIKK